MWDQVWDGHLESQKNPDRLKRSIHVDRLCLQSTFVYIYAGLRVLMIWANCFFLLTCLLRKVDSAFACRSSHVIRPQFDEVFRRETIVRSTKQQQQQQRQQQQKRTHCIQRGDSAPRLDLPQKSPLSYFVPRREQTRLFTARLRLATNVRTVKASHLANFSSKVPPWLGSADVEKRCLLPYTSTAAIRLPIYDRAVYSHRECWEMLQERTWVHFAQRGRSVFLARHHFELWPSTYLVCLVLRNAHAVSTARPRQTWTTSATSNFNPTSATYFLLASDPSFPTPFPLLLQFDLWKTFFADLSTRHFPFLPEFDLWRAYFVEPPRAFFSSGDYSIALSNDFDTVWPSGDFCQNLHVLTDGLFLLGPYSPFQI